MREKYPPQIPNETVLTNGLGYCLKIMHRESKIIHTIDYNEKCHHESKYLIKVVRYTYLI